MKIAINENFINKVEGKKNFKKLNTTFRNVDVSQRELAKAINKGYAFCPQHKNKNRSAANFACAGFVAVDIDRGATIEQMTANEFVQRYAAILYTTPSHSPEHHRFRIVFELERDITDTKEMKRAYRGIIQKFGGDPSCKDPCRLFFGSKGSNPTIFGQKLPNAILDELIELGTENEARHDSVKRRGSQSRSTIRSNRKLDENELVRDARGNTHRLGDLGSNVTIHCPVHIDHHPSAHTVLSRHGVLGVHCSACAATFFVNNDTPSFDFNYGLRNLDGFVAEEEGPEGDPILITEIAKANRINQRYLDLPELTESVIFIKSAKGTGKTEYLATVVERCKKARKRVLLIGHRRSLILSCARRLALQPYISFKHESNNEKDWENIEFNQPTPYYAICADSLSVLLTPSRDKYDVVLIDEIEQILAHLTSDTVKDKRNDTLISFKHYLNQSKQLYVLDADTNRLSVESIYDLVSDKQRSYRFIINDWKQEGREILLYQNQNHLKAELMDSLQQGERCFVCSNSKEKVNDLTRYLEEMFGERKRVISITRDNSDTYEIQEFISKINTEILNYDAVLVSPSVGTGVDITFPNNESRVDNVFGIFEARVNTHFDIDQQISRVRNPKVVKIWISPERFTFETEPDVVKREIENGDRDTRLLLDLEPDGTPVYRANEEAYLNLYTNVLCMQRASKNNLRYHFKSLKEHNGWKIVEIDKDPFAVERGKEIAVMSKELRKEDRITRILNAKPIDRMGYEELKKLEDRERRLTLDQTYAMRRYEIESFYLQNVSKELIELRSGPVR